MPMNFRCAVHFERPQPGVLVPSIKYLAVVLAAAATLSANASDKHAAPAHQAPAHDTPAHDVPAPTPPAMPPAGAAKPAASTPTPDEAIAMLKAGNARFVAGSPAHPHADAARRHEQATGGQTPFASILSCADSRVPAEMLFDAGFGDLFVVRVAGNISCTSEIGSLEYGAGHLHTPLIVVMGHTKCGAVTAAVKHADVHGSIPMLLQHIQPAVRAARAATSPDMPEAQFIDAAIHANVNEAIEETLERSEELRELVSEGKVKIVGAVYDIESGAVEWTGEHPNLAALLGKSEDPAKAEKPAEAEPAAHPAAAKKDHASH
jgi:carbonic anhydrase